MDSRTKFQDTEEYLAMLNRQQTAMQFNPSGMPREPMMRRNWPEAMPSMRGEDYTMQPIPTRNGRVTRMPFRPMDQAIPPGYEHMTTELNSPFGNFPSQNRKMWGAMGQGGGGLYMGHRPFPDYAVHQSQQGYLGNAQDGGIQGTAMTPIGTDSHGYQVDPLMRFTSNSGRMPPPMYNNPGSFRPDPTMVAQPQQDQAMQQEMNEYLKEQHRNRMLQARTARDNTLKRPRRIEIPYNSELHQWPHQNPTQGQMLPRRMPAGYDRMYGEARPLYPQHHRQYRMHNSMMPGVQSGERSYQRPRHEVHQIERVRRPQQPFPQDPGQLIPGFAEASNGPVPMNREEGMRAFRRLLMPKYHALDEALSTCHEAYKMYRDPAALQCMETIHNVLKFVKHVSSGKHTEMDQWYSLIPKAERKAIALIREAKQIKARLESPQSNNSTVIPPVEQSDEAVQRPNMPSSMQPPVIRARYPVQQPRTPSATPKERATSSGMDVIMVDGEEIGVRNDGQRLMPEETVSYKLSRDLRNDRPQTTHPALAHHQAVRKKRELPDSTYVVDAASNRDPCKRTVSHDNEKFPQAGVHKTSKIKSNVKNDDRHNRTSNDTNGIGQDHALAGTKCAEDVLLTSAEIDELLQELDIFEGADRWENSNTPIRDLRMGDDDWNYDRRFLEALANEATMKEEPSKMRECITQLTFKHDAPVTMASEVADVQVTQEGTEMDFPAVYQEINEECEALWKELELKDQFVVQCMQKSDAVEIVVEVEGYRNKDGDSDLRRAIKLILGPSYPEDAPVISFAVLPGQTAADYARHVFLTKVMDTGLMSISEILRLWFSEICPCHFETTPLQR